MKGTEISLKSSSNGTSVNAESTAGNKASKPPFRPAPDDTKPLLQDPILRSDPVETEEAVLRLPPFPLSKLK